MKMNDIVALAAVGGLAIVIPVASLLYGARDESAEFGGSDGQAEEHISVVDDSYEPWFQPVFGDIPPEVESGLFALQAGLGGIVLGYGIGFYRGRSSTTVAVENRATPIECDPSGTKESTS